MHQVSEEEAIRVATLHLEGKAHDWWSCEFYSLNYANEITYAKFIKRLVRRFDQKHSETSLVELAKPKQSKPLHELEGSIKPTPFQNYIEGVRKL